MTLEEFLINIALSSSTAALVSGVLNYFFKIRIFRRESEAGYMQAKAGLYSLILFYLEKMRSAARVLGHGEEKYVFKKGEIDETIKEINDAIKEKLHLLSPEAVRNWLELQAVVYQEASLPRVKRLRELLLQEYNDEIIPKYQKIVGKEARKLKYGEESGNPQQVHPYLSSMR